MNSPHYVQDIQQKIEKPQTEKSHVSKGPFCDIIYHKRHLHKFYAVRETMEFLPSEITQKYRLGGLVSMTTVRGVANRRVFIAPQYKAPMTLDACIAYHTSSTKRRTAFDQPLNFTYRLTEPLILKAHLTMQVMNTL